MHLLVYNVVVSDMGGPCRTLTPDPMLLLSHAATAADEMCCFGAALVPRADRSERLGDMKAHTCMSPCSPRQYCREARSDCSGFEFELPLSSLKASEFLQIGKGPRKGRSWSRGGEQKPAGKAGLDYAGAG